jgi:hypothetical protein
LKKRAEPAAASRPSSRWAYASAAVGLTTKGASAPPGHFWMRSWSPPPRAPPVGRPSPRPTRRVPEGDQVDRPVVAGRREGTAQRPARRGEAGLAEGREQGFEPGGGHRGLPQRPGRSSLDSSSFGQPSNALLV